MLYIPHKDLCIQWFLNNAPSFTFSATTERQQGRTVVQYALNGCVPFSALIAETRRLHV